MDATIIADDENLYRSVRPDKGEYRFEGDDLVFSHKAFDDVCMKPSVYRSAICADMKDAKLGPEQGVTKCTAKEVREISDIVLDPDAKGRGDKRYEPDALHRPEEPFETVQNKAHSQIECQPDMTSPGRFKKLKEALADIASEHGFLIDPTSSLDGPEAAQV